MPRTDPLDRYNAKRDFSKTPEPAGKRGKANGNSFVVQKHDATRLHWDFRLEIDGVLKSWAVTRGPSLDPEDKRLAVRTEDHPLDYGGFEGTIPQSEYGGGTVMLWDRGTWAPVEGKSSFDMEKGHLHFTLDGERMKGEWLLIRLKPRSGEKRENWLLRKIDDDFSGYGDVLVERELKSVATGRTMQEIASGKKAGAPKAQLKAAKPPAFEKLQLATLSDHVPDGGNWMHEAKYDGYRALIAIGGGQANLYVRSGLDWSGKFPALIRAAQTLPVGSALIDGEIVVLDANGNPDFSALQEAIMNGRPAPNFFAFDLLQLNGEDLRHLPNIERKEKLRPIITGGKTFHFAEHVLGSGEQLFQAMCKAGVEGIVSKRTDLSYSGRRTTAWLKVKCVQRQEFIILGWTRSNNSARRLRSLLMGAYEDGKLKYAGKVGTGFTGDAIAMLCDELGKIAADKPATEIPPAARRGAHWVKPDLVAEIAFNDITANGILRHASYIGLRKDKLAKEVVKEQPLPLSSTAPPKVTISSRERILFPEVGVTKGDLADYYQEMAGLVLATLSSRPLSLFRCPQGRSRQCFFQKHGAENLGDAIRAVEVTGKDDEIHQYLYVDDSAGLMECVQMGTIEFHGWGCRVSEIEKPDRLVFDLDPDVEMDFKAVIKAALQLKRHLSDMGLSSFPMLSGGKGLHVIVPLTPHAQWPEVADFAKRFATAMAEASPDRYVATMSKAKRKGRIFIDWLRNQRGATAIMPFSVRAREGAPVATPISWNELGEITGGGQFTIADRAILIDRANSKLLAGWCQAAQLLPDV